MSNASSKGLDCAFFLKTFGECKQTGSQPISFEMENHTALRENPQGNFSPKAFPQFPSSTSLPRGRCPEEIGISEKPESEAENRTHFVKMGRQRSQDSKRADTMEGQFTKLGENETFTKAWHFDAERVIIGGTNSCVLRNPGVEISRFD